MFSSKLGHNSAHDISPLQFVDIHKFELCVVYKHVHFIIGYENTFHLVFCYMPPWACYTFCGNVIESRVDLLAVFDKTDPP